MAAPIGVTVEGANILTRSLMIFGQGAIRCHPYALAEIHAVEKNDVAAFDKAFFGHLGHIVKNLVRTVVCELTRGFLIIPHRFDSTARYAQKLSWASAKFALFADIAMILFGGGLKAKERITARFGDILSWLYFATTVLRRYEIEGRKKEDLPLVRWSLEYSMHQIQVAFQGLFKNLGFPFRIFGFLGRLNSLGSYPADALSSQVAAIAQKVGSQRDRLTQGIYLSSDIEDPLRKLDHTFEALTAVAPFHKKMRQAIKKKQLSKAPIKDMIHHAVKANILTKSEAQLCLEAEDLRDDAVLVDEFTQQEYLQSHDTPSRVVENI